MDPARDEQLASLLHLARVGDRGAYERFLRETSVILRAYLARRMRSASDRVEDVLQETLLAVHRARHSHLEGLPLGPWLYAICEHRMTDFFRRHRRIEAVETSAEFPEVADAARAESESEGLGERVLQALLKLPRRQRLVIEGLKMRDLSVKEVALQAGMSESAVKVTAFRGYEAIRKMLGVKRP